ncbi:peptidoglycan-binding domain 1 protein [Deinococcus aerius]|uniref:Peptidoglycan-binding domain 1 protein n=2 Tax=Deinococcus TaxID=1298 RepID=A0A2I9DQT5_9DEIO|nr:MULTISPECIES: M23 family metallopeptidase [Deinococcus]MBB5293914.1 murein DD-endopeptidase MepM/ murein hydrolase activator NlpD [Deinococcus metallilatus]QBY07147.1 LysM peptidoglycan-binding domain-containing protein [Deinococcus metallilatus]RXJ14619.1 LysM peptidoglycan-binding domain-containing protein [Deinococcus metallilatus]TLK30739.1 M23 family metallopeptidase [Deinococcus metallilatus]GBF04627.1 peptidoglycan-binding domain 1 protein [Deinococcus aerius]
MRNHLFTALTLLMFSLAAATTVTVQPGDTLTRLAVRHGTTTQALLRANPGVNPNRLRVGTALSLPAAPTRTWTVRRGDTLSMIAQRHGITLGVLLGVNRGLNPRLPLQVGQRLTLPAPALARASTTAVVRAASIRVNAALPVQGRVTTPYQAAHPGLDLAVPAGTPIRAALPGTVVESRFDSRSGWGWTVVLDHGGGVRTRYSHNSANLVRVGARVRAGDVIARVGSTGKSTGAHVDYRLYREGQAVNPSGVQ